MSIRSKLLMLAVGIFAGMGAALFQAYLSLVAMQDITEEASLVHMLRSDMLMLRRHEKDFLARLDPGYLEKFKQVEQEFVDHFKTLEKLTANSSQSVITPLTQYGDQFESLVENYTELGLDHTSGYYGQLRADVHEAEKNSAVR